MSTKEIVIVFRLRCDARQGLGWFAADPVRHLVYVTSAVYSPSKVVGPELLLPLLSPTAIELYPLASSAGTEPVPLFTATTTTVLSRRMA